MQRILTIASCAALVLASSTGCSVWNNKTKSDKSGNWSISKYWKKEYQQPQSLVVIWAPDVLTIAGKPPTRGFGGRIYFYNELSQAIPVDGELMVHGYNRKTDSNQSPQVAADKTFGFTGEQLTSHFSPSELGASYSIWIPWDSADGFREEVTLIPTFKGKDGTIVQGAASKANLPGRNPAAPEELPGPMQTVSYTKSSTPTNLGIGFTPGENLEPKKMRTTTIAVPANATLAKPQRYMSHAMGNAEGSRQRTLQQPMQQGEFNQSSLQDYQGNAGGLPGGNGVSIGGQNSTTQQLPSGQRPSGQLPGNQDLGGQTRAQMRMPNLSNLTPMPNMSTTLSPASNRIGTSVFGSSSGPTRATISAFPPVQPLPPPSKPDWEQRLKSIQPASAPGLD